MLAHFTLELTAQPSQISKVQELIAQDLQLLLIKGHFS
jgi:hypothetical protein